ncbi:glycosyltransferase family 4 protein [Halosolutus halophilus]|uniref:glycosyltransferase family 4 protein n=1 Tax=Halosolutus halophilus TaxID=1552990 RepID=UPI0022351C91|nr:glycosyltransferase family 4 protein [Halosolutus halophilus]
MIDPSIEADASVFTRTETESTRPSQQVPASSNRETATNQGLLTSRETDVCNLVYVITTLDTGGAEVGLCRLLDGLNDDRYDVTIATLDGYDETFVDRRVPDVESIIDCKRLRTPRDVSRLVSAVVDADVIVGSLFHSVLVARLAGVVNPDAVVATWQHNERFQTTVRKKVFETTNSLSTVLLADSEPVAEMLRDEFGLSEEFVKTVPIAGIPLDEFERREHEDTDCVVVGSVGVLSEQKNYRTLLAVADALSDDEIVFRIAGDGPRRRALESRIESAGIENVEFLGAVRDLPQFLDTVDIYAQPSLYEGLCITVIEAMAAGLPVVGSSVGGIEHSVADGECGYLHEPDDVTGFCRSIRKLAADPSKRQQFGDRGREFVETDYSQDVLVEEFQRAIHGDV